MKSTSFSVRDSTALVANFVCVGVSLCVWVCLCGVLMVLLLFTRYLMSGESSGVQRLKAANYDMICWDSPRHQTIYYTASGFLLM